MFKATPSEVDEAETRDVFQAPDDILIGHSHAYPAARARGITEGAFTFNDRGYPCAIGCGHFMDHRRGAVSAGTAERAAGMTGLCPALSTGTP